MKGASHRSLVKHRRARRKVARKWSAVRQGFEILCEAFEDFGRFANLATLSMSEFVAAWNVGAEPLGMVIE